MAVVSQITDMDSDSMTHSPVIQRALLSVSDKTGLADFAASLAARGIELFSTGGTRQHLQDHGLNVNDVSDYTGFPEIMDGRVKTLHPKIFGGILCRLDNDEDVKTTDQLGIQRFELVVVNLYPFEQAVSGENVTEQVAIENINIGGPSLVRAAAKNSSFVTIATSPDQYPAIEEQIREKGCTTRQLRKRLMSEAFAHTARYDSIIADFFTNLVDTEDGSDQPSSTLPPAIRLHMKQRSLLRYGENSHQPAALYELHGGDGPDLVNAEQLNGKQLSFNNYLDLDAALTMVSSFELPACVVIKHNNPCGAAIGEDLADTCQRAFEGDPVSAFGSIVGFNRELDASTADYLSSAELFVEAILAPAFQPEAIEILTTKPKWKKNVRLIACQMTPNDATGKQTRHSNRQIPRRNYRQIHGGMLVQNADALSVDPDKWTTATDREIDIQTMQQLAFAWNMVRFVKSNAIVLATEQALCGVGAGQMSRVDSVRIAIEKAGPRSRGSVLASDAFFPFPDSIEIAAGAGITAVIQPGGSVKDDAVVEACREHGVDMVFTGRRHFLH